ncbi:formate dehydrogenase [Shewanella sp. 3B26]|jgi:ribosomal protein L12E/L44/L45/RPP1/RPP2|uniref:Formate dehydrogenase n=1 Tax=Shewanella zhuhaiensis TaxID=2919576 RepID=A0AAJ1EYE6_9GAMM|nr:formate dehydrogenase [Shewanella zhuhaiensis]MCH4295024.1 formate dehydrogenase [Shewanella zhuhaiensis]
MKKPASEMSRRELLKALAIGGGAVAAATVAGSATAAAPTEAASEEQSDKYRETEHIRNYYATLRN